MITLDVYSFRLDHIIRFCVDSSMKQNVWREALTRSFIYTTVIKIIEMRYR